MKVNYYVKLVGFYVLFVVMFTVSVLKFIEVKESEQGKETQRISFVGRKNYKGRK